MAKKPVRAKKTLAKRETNWLLIGGILVAGVAGLFALLYLTLRVPEALALSDYCQEAEANCVAYGAPNAPVTLVEVSDFGCPHCRDFHQDKASSIKERFVDEGLVRWVFLPYALGPDTVPAASAALCANEQGQYYEFSQALFDLETIEQSVTRDGFIAASEKIGLNSDDFLGCLDDGRYDRIVNANQLAAQSAGVSATPTFFVNDQIVRGNRPLEEFVRLFDDIINS